MPVPGPSPSDGSALDRAVERLHGAYAVAGLPPIKAPRDVEPVLEAVRREIAPLSLPTEVERFWHLVDPTSLIACPFPDPTDPAHALDIWVEHRKNVYVTPRLLFPFGYFSGSFLLVELEDGSGAAGALLEWGYGDGVYTVVLPSLSAYVDLLAVMVERGELCCTEEDGSLNVEFDPEERWTAAQAEVLDAARPLPRLGATEQIDDDVESWPEHWLVAQGLTPEVRMPRGATATVSGLRRAAAAGEAATGTVRGTVVRLTGGDAGNRVSVDDGSGVMEVWCPTGLKATPPVIRETFELDLVVRAGAPGPVDVWAVHELVGQRLAVGDHAGAAEAAAGLPSVLDLMSAEAEATAIRKLAEEPHEPEH